MEDIYSYDKKHEEQTEQTTIRGDTVKKKKEQYIENLREGDTVNEFLAVKMKNPPRAYKRGTWFSFIASDKTGEISVFTKSEKSLESFTKVMNDSFSIDLNKLELKPAFSEILEIK